MSRAGNYFRTGMSIVNTLAGEKPHSSITDWVEVLSSDRYGELSLDGIPELVDSVNLQGPQGTAEAARAIRKKLKYGNVHRQLRALVILRALTENASKVFQLNWADERLMERLKLMATDVSEPLGGCGVAWAASTRGMWSLGPASPDTAEHRQGRDELRHRQSRGMADAHSRSWTQRSRSA